MWGLGALMGPCFSFSLQADSLALGPQEPSVTEVEVLTWGCSPVGQEGALKQLDGSPPRLGTNYAMLEFSLCHFHASESKLEGTFYVI